MLLLSIVSANHYMIGDADYLSCSTIASSFHKSFYSPTGEDYLYLSGKTFSPALFRGDTRARECLPRAVPFMMKTDDDVIMWEKYFDHKVTVYEGESGIISDIVSIKMPSFFCDACSNIDTALAKYVSALFRFQSLSSGEFSYEGSILMLINGAGGGVKKTVLLNDSSPISAGQEHCMIGPEGDESALDNYKCFYFHKGLRPDGNYKWQAYWVHFNNFRLKHTLDSSAV